MENKKLSLRQSEKYDRDDSEVEVCLELKTQLAQELAMILDSQLHETDKMTSSNSLPPSDTDDLCFKLFTTSDPSKCPKALDQPRRQPVEDSTSDSDSEYERLASVAVSAKQVLSGSGLRRTDTNSMQRDKLVKNRAEHCKQHSNSSACVDDSDDTSVKKTRKQEGRISDVTLLNGTDTKRAKKHKKRMHKCSDTARVEISEDDLNERTDGGKTVRVTPPDGTAPVCKTGSVVKKKRHKKRKFVETEK